jgi:tetratricopeptide (TPR) repeat protein
MKKKTLGVVAIGCLLVVGLTGCTKISGTKAYSDGVTSIKSGDYNSASKYLTTAIHINKNQKDYYISYGVTMLQLSRYGEALSSFNRVLGDESAMSNNETAKRTYRGAGIAYYYLKDFKKSTEYINKALSYSEIPDLNNDCYLYLGAIKEVQGDAQGAFDSYVKALELNPSSLMASVGKYKAAVSLGKLDVAKQALEAGLKLKASTAEDKYMYAKLQFYNNDPQSQTGLMNAAEQGYPEAYLFLGQAAENQGNHDMAISYFKTYTSKTGDERNLILCTQLAKCYMNKQNFDQAMTWADRGADLNASNYELLEVRLLQLSIFKKSGKLENAMTLAKRYTKLYPNDAKITAEYNSIEEMIANNQ